MHQLILRIHVTERIKRDVLVVPAEDDDRRLRQRFRLPDALSADTSLRDVFEDLYAFLLAIRYSHDCF